MELDEESKRHVVITTHNGLYRYNRLCFGIAFAPAIFQGIIEQISHEVKGVQLYLDDCAHKGLNNRDHLQVLRHTFSTLRQAGVKLKREKCVFMQKSIKYFGHILDTTGLRPDPDKVEAILKAPPPHNREQLESCFGMVQYYGRHVPELSTISGLLNELRRKNVLFKWTPQQHFAFEKLKGKLAGRGVLTHFDGKRDFFWQQKRQNTLVMCCFIKPNPRLWKTMSSLQQVHMLSVLHRPLNEKQSTTICKSKTKRIAIIFDIKKYDKYHMGRHFTLYTDHKPLVRLFDLKQVFHKPRAPRQLEFNDGLYF